MSRFKNILVENDYQLLHLTRYIHLNPLKLVKKLPTYKWSSYPAYIENFVDEITDNKFILGYFKRKNQTIDDAKREYKLFVRSQEDYNYKIKDLTYSH